MGFTYSHGHPPRGARRRGFQKSLSAAALIGLAILSACGGSSATSSPAAAASQSPKASSPAAAKTSSAPAAGQATQASAAAGASQGAQSLSALTAAAAKEGGFTLYAVQDQHMLAGYTDTFAKAYGIKNANYTRLISGPLEERFLTEAKAGHVQPDIVMNVDPPFFSSHADLFAPLSADQVPSIAKYPKSAVTKYAIAINLVPIGIAYNTNLVKGADVPQTWQDLLKPQFSGHLILNDPRTSPNYADWFDSVAQQFGDDFLKKLAAQHYTVQQSGATAAQSLAAGSALIDAPMLPVFVNNLPKGAPVKFVLPSGETYDSPTFVGIPAKAPHPETARLFLNWLLSPDGVAVTCQPAWGVGVPPGTQGPTSDCMKISSNNKEMTYVLTPARKDQVFKALALP